MKKCHDHCIFCISGFNSLCLPQASGLNAIPLQQVSIGIDAPVAKEALFVGLPRFS